MHDILLFLGLLITGILIPLAIWYAYDKNRLIEMHICNDCKKTWEEE